MDKEETLRRLEAEARCEARRLARDLARAAPEEREAVLAEFEYQRWLMECYAEIRHPL